MRTSRTIHVEVVVAEREHTLLPGSLDAVQRTRQSGLRIRVHDEKQADGIRVAELRDVRSVVGPIFQLLVKLAAKLIFYVLKPTTCQLARRTRRRLDHILLFSTHRSPWCLLGAARGVLLWNHWGGRT